METGKALQSDTELSKKGLTTSTIAYGAEDLADLVRCLVADHGFPIAECLVGFAELALANEVEFRGSYGFRHPFARVNGPEIMEALATLIGVSDWSQWQTIGDDGIRARCKATESLNRLGENEKVRFEIFFGNCALDNQSRTGLGPTSKSVAVCISQIVNCNLWT